MAVNTPECSGPANDSTEELLRNGGPHLFLSFFEGKKASARAFIKPRELLGLDLKLQSSVFSR
jgi:hypothetical protein